MPSNAKVRNERGGSQEPVFECNTKPLHYTKATWNCTSVPRPKWVGLTSVQEITVHSWRAVLRHADVLDFFTYQSAAFIPSCCPPWIEINNIPLFHRLEQMYGSDAAAIGRPFGALDGSELRRWYDLLVTRGLWPRKTGVYLYAQKMAVAKACLLLSEHLQLVVCEKDEYCVEESLSSLV